MGDRAIRSVFDEVVRMHVVRGREMMTAGLGQVWECSK